ncbi:MAG TPA: hypothetical protein VFY13_05335 [Luteolibacter sp.]|nr:hypothetical protein [Luteolibacter sp.]
MLLLALLLLFMAAAGFAHMTLRKYLRSEEFRVFLSKKVSDAIHAEGQFQPLLWDGFAVNCNGYEASGGELVRELRVEDLSTEIGLGGFWRRVWEIRHSQIRKLDLTLGGLGAPPAAAAPVEPAPPIVAASPDEGGWLPREVELKRLDIGELVVRAPIEQGMVTMQGTQAKISSGAGKQSYVVNLNGGTLDVPIKGIPQMRLDTVRFKVQNGAVFLNQFDAHVWEEGRLAMTGEWDPAVENRSLQGGVSGVQCREVLTGDWVKRVSGVASTDFRVVMGGQGTDAQGRLVVENGVLTALPFLDALAAYANTKRFRVLQLSEAHTQWQWRDGELKLTDLVLASEGLMRVEGSLTIRGERLDGQFRVGLAPGTLSSIPGAEEHVFLPGERGLRWAPMRVYGTTSEPKQDLKERMIKAAGRRMLEVLPETGGKVIEATGDVIKGSADKIIEGGAGVLNKIFGGGEK